MTRALILRPSAKINLTLVVGPRRADGFHDLRTLIQSIALSDRLVLTPRKGPFALETRAPFVPADRTNLVWRAAEVFWRALGRTGEPRDVHAKLEKQIPTAAGLGGGSADAAAALAGLNVAWNARWPRRELARLAADLGSDVPFFFQGGTALAAGRGDEIYPVDDIARLGIVLIKPSFGVSTADAYRWLDEDREAPPPAVGLASAGTGERRPFEIEVGWPGHRIALRNDLESPVTRRHPAIGEMVDACVREGTLGAAMTGSGSAIFAVFPEAVAKRAVRKLMRPDWLVLLTRTLTRREAARRLGL